ncbi:unnamed protein product [Chironomus riparius]|uniref:GB1/RHD3-type G domain-containing protein n=1 Tax=Chironomus riparius TaxID=315576 RepID=A0A9N9SAN7_9DIPT|nr:unnamed protein product [Chironomus riparius]
MDHTHPHGKPISILTFSDNKEVIVDNRELEKIFNHPEIQDRKVVILSLIGAFRGGKSFFLDYCLRFLYAHFPSINNPSKPTQFFFRKDNNWMGKPDEPLKGFSWRSGAKRETIGINIWSDVFLHTIDRTGEEVAIFIMDTQGLFDNDSTPTDNSRIFALGTLISSIQVLNLKQQIQEDQLQYLQFATEFAQFNAKKNGRMDGKPFQNLTFLIRDWQNFDDYEFGPNGGKKYFEEEVLKIKSSHAPELRSVREFVKNSFEEIGCCLLPYPGMDVAGSKNYDGKWSKMDQTFKNELKHVIEHLLMPEKLTLKKINSQKLAVKEVKVYIQRYLKLFQSGEIPKTPTLYQFILESNMSNLIKKCIEQYKAGIYNFDLKHEEDIPKAHKRGKYLATQMYDDEDKMGDRQQKESFKYQLNQKLEEIYEEFKNVQERRFRELNKVAERHRIQLEEERRRMEQAEREQRQKEAEFREVQARMEQERREAEEERQQKEKEWRNYQMQLEKNQNALQERLEQEERKRKESENSFGSFLGKVVKGTGLVLAAPFVAVGGTVATGTAALAGAVHSGSDGASSAANECADAIFGGYERAFKKL